MSINIYTIKLIYNQQQLYRFIYYLQFRKQKTLKTGIKINLINGFISYFKFFIDNIIFFVQKSNANL